MLNLDRNLITSFRVLKGQAGYVEKLSERYKDVGFVEVSNAP
jgi:hypothetical protein